MSPLPQLSGQECLALLQRHGFRLVRQKGSHMIVRRDTPFSQVVIPDHDCLDRGTLRAILRQAGLSPELFSKR